MKCLVITPLLIVLLNLALPSTATSQTKEGNIRELLEIAEIERDVRQSVGLVWPQIWELATKAHPELPNELLSELEVEFLTTVDETMPAFLEGVGEIYSNNFTDEEIAELLAWYKTSLGQKTVRVMPRLLEQSVAWGQVWGEKFVLPKVVERITERLLQKGYKL